MSLNIERKIEAFAKLGDKLGHLKEHEFELMAQGAEARNNWFDRQNVKAAILGLAHMLRKDKLEKWLSNYPELNQEKEAKTIGVVMAGNIPAVGFHDFMCVLLSPHRLLAKLSGQDSFLLKIIAEYLTEIEPAFRDRFEFVERLNGSEAYIATGSDNTARYFSYYFSKHPHIIRPNKSSCAVLDGNESDEDLEKLGEDIFRFYGLGCRNVSKLFVPEDYSFQHFLDLLSERYKNITHNHKYSNNYDYNKSIYLVNRIPHLDTGFLLVAEDKALISPISALFYERYSDAKDLEAKIGAHKEKIQCVVGKGESRIPFGMAQHPEPWDYADGIDTMEFLLKL
ncbi:acyl-CoA reductase [Fulvitalea axinellae]|uniref:Acyl-CoA reductase n=1 Tax=Fulvitalea axinellae TaxID=1182444 RepID=A0AAU9D3U3_9BACT|nr:acyl-CoA reductase [Fulvitalea axinellae]